MQSRMKRAREIQAAIEDILMREWDPIGVREEPEAAGEYDHFVGGVYRLLTRRPTPEEVAQHLLEIEVEQMGGSRADGPKRLLPVARRLLALDIGLQKD